MTFSERKREDEKKKTIAAMQAVLLTRHAWHTIKVDMSAFLLKLSLKRFNETVNDSFQTHLNGSFIMLESCMTRAQIKSSREKNLNHISFDVFT